MQEIKFRARNAEVPPCWIYGYFVIEEGRCYIINNNGKFKVMAGTETQYIGKKDGNGKEIYDKDIVEIKFQKYTSRFVVTYHNYKWLYKPIDEDHFQGYFDLENDAKIIGNTHENSELLKKKGV